MKYFTCFRHSHDGKKKNMYLYDNTLKGNINYINIYCTIFKLGYVARNIFNSTILKGFLVKSGKV